MRKLVKRIISRYDTYVKNKPTRYTPYRQLKSLDTPSTAWDLVLIDFIVKLPPSKELFIDIVYNSILVIVD